MWRAIRSFAFFALIGLILTCLVSWTLVVVAHPEPLREFMPGSTGDDRMLTRETLAASEWDVVWYRPYAGDLSPSAPAWIDDPYWIGPVGDAFNKLERSPGVITHWIAQGWPFRSFKGVSAIWFTGIRASDPQGDGGSRGLFEIRTNQGTQTLAFAPIWPGLLANTTTYAAAMWLLYVTPRSLKRRSRRLRSRCVNCGYDLRTANTNTPCPDCGQSPC